MLGPGLLPRRCSRDHLPALPPCHSTWAVFTNNNYNFSQTCCVDGGGVAGGMGMMEGGVIHRASCGKPPIHLQLNIQRLSRRRWETSALPTTYTFINVYCSTTHILEQSPYTISDKGEWP